MIEFRYIKAAQEKFYKVQIRSEDPKKSIERRQISGEKVCMSAHSYICGPFVKDIKAMVFEKESK